MRRQFLSFALTLGLVASAAADGNRVKVACVGNSITYGAGVENRERNAYPFQLGSLLGDGYEVGNFGKSGATLLRKGHRPYVDQPEYDAALGFCPDVVIIHLGINDTDPRNWPNYGDNFVSEYVDLINSFRSVNPDVRVILANLSPLLPTHHRFRSGTRVWRDRIREAIVKVAEATGAELIDYGETLRDVPNLIPDGIHPDSAGSALLAQAAYGALTGNYGGLKLPRVWSDGMVLQRYKPLAVNGTADTGAEIDIRIFRALDGKEVNRGSAVADNRGRWTATLRPMAETEGLVMTVTDGKTTRRIDDVAVGEVWLASGQSNMEFRLKQTTTFRADSTILADTRLRLFDMKPRVITDSREWKEADKDSLNRMNYYKRTSWQRSTPATAGEFSAVAWYFGKMLSDSLDVPVGIICNAIGGSGTEAWIDIESLEQGMPEVLVNWRKNDYLQPWVQQRVGENVGKDSNRNRHPYEPGYLFANGIRPLGAFPIAGTIWYQGESNAHNIEVHEDLFRLLVGSWRSNWNQPDMPFLFTQLSSIDRPSWPEFRNSQRLLAEEIPWTAMAVTLDHGDSLDVHPRNKRPVGERLARQALNRVYSMTGLTPSGPLPFEAVRTAPGKVELTMDYGEGMHASDGQALRTFEVAGIDGLYYPATAVVDSENNRITVTNMEIQEPRFVRYAWQPFTRANLVNGDNLPASTFKMAVVEAPDHEEWINAGVSAAYAGMADGRIIRAGGCNFPGNPMAQGAAKKFYSGIYQLERTDGGFSTRLIGYLPEGMAYGAAVTTPQGLAIIGGTNAKEALSSAWMLNVDDSGKAALTPLPSLPATVDNMAACYADGKIYVAGGNVDGMPSNALFCLDLSKPGHEWQTLKPFPGNPRVQPVLAASDADGKMRLYMWGGFAGKGAGREASLDCDGYAYTPSNGKWTPLAAPKGTRGEEVSTGGGTAVTLADGTIYVSGGVNKDVFLEALRNQAPDYLSHPVEWYRFNDLGLVYNPSTSQWTIKSQGAENARAGASALVDGSGRVVISGGEIKPRIRTAEILDIKL